MIVLVMGVAGSGKSTIGKLLAERLGVQFRDADDYHSPENRKKMAADVALEDADRWPWLEQLASLAATEWQAAGGAVLACSALKQAYRDALLRHVPAHLVVFLELSQKAAEQRLERRRGSHQIIRDFQRVLAGQYRDLEPPQEGITVSAELPPAEIVERVMAFLQH